MSRFPEPSTISALVPTSITRVISSLRCGPWERITPAVSAPTCPAMHGRKYAQAPGLRSIPRSRAFTVTPRSTTSGNGSIPSWVGSMPSTRWCIVGLPTRAASTMSSRSMPASAATAAASSRIAPCTAAVSAGAWPSFCWR